MTNNPLVLCIMDGLGERLETKGNAVLGANTPTLDQLRANYPMTLLEASEQAVGLPKGQMGNSEVGHTAIGAGRAILQDLPRINQAITDGSLARDAKLKQSINTLKQSRGALHLMGLASSGGVHSHSDHLIALANAFLQAGVRVWLHLWLDGRDTPPMSAKTYVDAIIKACPKAKIATLCGRYYAMDRDQRWARMQPAYDAMVSGISDGKAEDWVSAIESAYDRQITDEFIEPTVFDGFEGIASGDGVAIANFRADRVRQISSALFLDDFNGFLRSNRPHFVTKLVMADYDSALLGQVEILFPPQQPSQTLGEVLAAHGLRQLRLAETEKYAHVTYFFNGGREQPFEKEERILIPSPKVATYDLQPEMSLEAVTDALMNGLNNQLYDVIIVNYANPDMVGHTGSYEAAVKAIEAVDRALSQVIPCVLVQNGTILVTSDHGNSETMIDLEHSIPHTAHTLCKVPFILVKDGNQPTLNSGSLIDIAPTMLELLGLDIPPEMTGHSLLV